MVRTSARDTETAAWTLRDLPSHVVEFLRDDDRRALTQAAAWEAKKAAEALGDLTARLRRDDPAAQAQAAAREAKKAAEALGDLTARLRRDDPAAQAQAAARLSVAPARTEALAALLARAQADKHAALRPTERRSHRSPSRSGGSGGAHDPGTQGLDARMASPSDAS
jgi:hypothetical protein